MLRTIKVFISLLCFTVGAAHAENGESRLYYGLDLGNGKNDVSSTDDDTLIDIGAALGYNLARFLAVEARLGVGSSDKNSLVGDSEVNRGSVLLKLQYKKDRVIAYAAGGIGVVNSDIDGVSDDDDGLVLGVGLELFGTSKTALAISYTNYERDDSGLDYEVTSVGFRHYFGSQF